MLKGQMAKTWLLDRDGVVVEAKNFSRLIVVF